MSERIKHEFHPDVLEEIIRTSAMEKNRGKYTERYDCGKSIQKENSGYVLSQALGQRNYGMNITEYKSGPYSRMF